MTADIKNNPGIEALNTSCKRLKQKAAESDKRLLNSNDPLAHFTECLINSLIREELAAIEQTIQEELISFENKTEK